MSRAVNGMKECSKCHQVKPVSEFTKLKRAADGLQYVCKSCRGAEHAAWRRANPDKARAHAKKWEQAHPEEARKSHSKSTIKWQQTHREDYNAYQRAYYARNREQRRLYLNTWRTDRAHPKPTDLDDPS